MTLDDLAGRATITVPEAGQILGIGRDAAYAAAQRGELPTLRFGRRLVVSVARLSDLLGPLATPSPTADTDLNMRTTGVPTPAAAATVDVSGGRRDQHRTQPPLSA